MRRRGRPEGKRLFFATDLHGSTLCFKKFVNAAAFYAADLLVLGGDLSGKQLITFARDGGDTWTYRLGGLVERVRDADVRHHESRIANMGYYAVRVDDRERATGAGVEDPGYDDLLLQRAIERLREWGRYAQERLDGSGVRILVAPGNDDDPSIDDALSEFPVFEHVEGRAIDLPELGGLTLASTGFSNPTPWRTHRELSEDDLYTRLRGLVDGLDPDRSLLNIHVPPHLTQIDTCPELDEDLRVKTSFGHSLMTNAGSTAVRRIIEEFQPLASLHGHIHEATGAVTIGRTVCINPGSEYSEGVLKGTVLTFDGQHVAHRLTVG